MDWSQTLEEESKVPISVLDGCAAISDDCSSYVPIANFDDAFWRVHNHPVLYTRDIATISLSIGDIASLSWRSDPSLQSLAYGVCVTKIEIALRIHVLEMSSVTHVCNRSFGVCQRPATSVMVKSQDHDLETHDINCEYLTYLCALCLCVLTVLFTPYAYVNVLHLSLDNVNPGTLRTILR